jgi:hypothetical protein
MQKIVFSLLPFGLCLIVLFGCGGGSSSGGGGEHYDPEISMSASFLSAGFLFMRFY